MAANKHSPFNIFVNREITCEECPFYIEDTNKGYLEKDKYRCLLRAKNVSGQYGGLDFCETQVRECPLAVLPCMDKPNGKCPTCGCEKCGGKDTSYSTRTSSGFHTSKVDAHSDPHTDPHASASSGE